MVHLVRDSRAVAFSWTRHRSRPLAGETQRDMARFGVTQSAATWAGINLGVHALRLKRVPYMRVRYEDFVAAPREHAAKLLRFMGASGEPDFVGEHEVVLAPGHGVQGNLMRFDSGAISITADMEWRSRMSRRDRLLATAITAPFLLTYGYLGPGSRPRGLTSQAGRRRR